MAEMTKAAMIRECLREGMTVGETARKLGIRYQYVNQIAGGVDFEVARAERKHVLVTVDGQTMARADAIRLLWKQGLSKGEIARRLRCQYQVVWQTVSALENRG